MTVGHKARNNQAFTSNEKTDETCDHTIVHTGQNYDFELNEIFFEDLEIRKPDFFRMR